MNPETNHTTTAPPSQVIGSTVTHSLLLVHQARRVAAALQESPKAIADQALKVYRETGNRFEARRYLQSVAFAQPCAEVV